MALKPWQRLFDKFNTIFTRDLSNELPNPASLSGAGIGRADAVGNSEYLEGGSTFSHAVEITDLNDFLEVGEHTDRRARYLEYDRMENIPEISSALDTYGDEVTVPDMNGKVLEIKTPNQQVKEEAEWLLFDLLKIHQNIWDWSRNLCKNGDIFLENIIDADNPSLGIVKVMELPPETMYRIETVRGRLLEFQQSYLGPDYQALLNDIKEKSRAADQAVGHFPSNSPVTTTGGYPNQQFGQYEKNNVIRFSPHQVTHMRIGMRRRGFYPYGVSILYAGRRTAHLLKLMEDAMVIYRLVRSPERRVFYIDVGHLPPNKGEQVLERMRDKIKKKKVFNNRTGQIDERYNPWAADEDFFLATRPESNTRVETLPGGQSLGEIDDTKYFREKLMVALKLPKNYLFQDDTNVTRTSFATQDMRFARTIYRIQKILAEGIKEILVRHLYLKGFVEEDVKKLDIEFTAPSDWMELSRNEILNSKFNLAGSVKSSLIYDDYTILTEILGNTREKALEIISRLEEQQLRAQEINAQGQIFAQLATLEPEGQQNPLTPGLDQGFGGEVPLQSPGLPQAIPGIEVPQGIPEPEQQQLPSPIEKEEKKEPIFTDFGDLEADEEEIDLNY